MGREKGGIDQWKILRKTKPAAQDDPKSVVEP